MQWIPPSNDSLLLYLPELQDFPKVVFDAISMSSNKISTTVSKEFLNAWISPPKNKTCIRETQDRLTTISHSFCDLIIQAQNSLVISQKTNPLDSVTNVDKGIEMLFRIWIQTHYPNHAIIGEEGHKDTWEDNKVTWFIDPIDGTQSMIDGNNTLVTIQFGSLYNGKAYISYVGYPFLNTYYTSSPLYSHCPKPIKSSYFNKNNSQSPLRIGTEYFPNNIQDKNAYETILNELNATSYRIYSIGSHLMALFHGQIQGFYKPLIKLWDVVAPLIFITEYLSHIWDVSIWYRSSSKSPLQQASPIFSSIEFIQHVNIQQQKNSRVGLLTVTKKNHPNSLEVIKKYVS